MSQLKAVLIALSLLSGIAIAQNSRYDNVALGPRGPIPGATIAVCTQPANTSTQPCSPLATLCSSLSDVACIQPNPVTADSLGNYHFYLKQAQSPFTVQIYGPQVASPLVLPDQSTGAGLGTNNTFTGNNTFATTNVKSLNSIQFADQFTGADCGAKINAADAALGSTPGEIWVNQACGTAWTTAVSISSKHVLRFVQGGTYTVSATVTLSDNTVLAGVEGSMSTNTTPTVMIQQANSVNLAAIVNVTGAYATIQDINIDGNRTNNGTAGSNIVAATTASRLELQRVTSGHSNTHGVLVSANSIKAFKLMSYENVQDGLFCNGGTTGADGFVIDSEFESNGANGVELSSCSAWRILHNDFGTNSQTGASGCAMKIYGTTTQPSNLELLGYNQFGNNFRHDLCVTGYNAGYSSIGSNIVSNSFIGSSNLLAANTYSQLNLTDAATNTIVGNVFTASAGTSNLAGINSTETAGGRAETNQVSGNQFIDSFTNAGSPAWGTAPINDTTTSAVVSQSNGAVIKHKRFASPLGGTCPTGAAIGNACTSANLTWTQAFRDNNYTVSCTLDSPTNQPHIVAITKLASGAGVTITIATDLASAANAGAECIAVHD